MHMGIPDRTEPLKSHFSEFKMADGLHLEKLKDRHISAKHQPILMKFGKITQTASPKRISC